MAKLLASQEPQKIKSQEPQKNEIFDTRRVVNTLEKLMTDVTDSNVTPQTVQAACQCADKIVDILRLHLDVERLKTKMNPRIGNDKN